MPVTVAVDAMGGDHGPSVTLPAACAFLEAHPDARVIAVGLEEPLDAALGEAQVAGADAADASQPRPRSSRWTSRRPTRCAARRIRRCASRSTSSRTARAQACVSAGNTGALMAIVALRAEDAARHRPPGDRRRSCRRARASTTVLDLGANVNCTPEQLRAVRRDGHARWSRRSTASSGPTVGLLNIGEEDIKGNEVVKQTAELLKASGAQLLRQRRRQRHLQGHDRRRRLRRLRRQRRAEDLRGPGGDALRLPQGRVHAQPADQARGAGRLSGAEGVQAARRSAALQRRDAARPARASSSRATAAPTRSRSSTR